MRWRIVRWPECYALFLDPEAIPLEMEHAACAVPDPDGEYERVEWPESREAIEAGAPTDGSSAFVRRPAEMSLVFGYFYRDACNYKTGAEIGLSGEMPEGIETVEAFGAAIRALCDGDNFVASQVGLETCFGWEGHPGGNDHCWHEYGGVWEATGIVPEAMETPRAFFERFKKAAEGGWNPDLEITDEWYLHPSVWVLEGRDADTGVSRGVFGVYGGLDEAREAAHGILRRAGGDPNDLKATPEKGDSATEHRWLDEELGLLFVATHHVVGKEAV